VGDESLQLNLLEEATPHPQRAGGKKPVPKAILRQIYETKKSSSGELWRLQDDFREGT